MASFSSCAIHPVTPSSVPFFLLRRLQPTHQAVKLLLRLLSYAAGIHDHDVGALSLTHFLKTSDVEKGADLLHIVFIHLATKVFDVVLHVLPIRLRLIFPNPGRSS